MNNRRAELGFDIVADDWQVPCSETLSELLVAGNEHGHVIDQRHAGFQRALRVEARRLL